MTKKKICVVTGTRAEYGLFFPIMKKIQSSDCLELQVVATTMHFSEEFGVDIGYSDHTLGIEVDIAAVAMGASCIEKHFTLDKTMDGPDHKASLEPEELKAMVGAIRNIEKALGSSEKKPSPSESVNIDVARKSIVASQSIKIGDKLSSKNITTKRPGTGINPMKWDEIIATSAKKDYRMDDPI